MSGALKGGDGAHFRERKRHHLGFTLQSLEGAEVPSLQQGDPSGLYCVVLEVKTFPCPWNFPGYWSRA